MTILEAIQKLKDSGHTRFSVETRFFHNEHNQWVVYFVWVGDAPTRGICREGRNLSAVVDVVLAELNMSKSEPTATVEKAAEDAELAVATLSATEGGSHS